MKNSLVDKSALSGEWNNDYLLFDKIQILYYHEILPKYVFRAVSSACPAAPSFSRFWIFGGIPAAFLRSPRNLSSGCFHRSLKHVLLENSNLIEYLGQLMPNL